MPKSVKRARSVHVGLCGTCGMDPLCTFPRRPGVPLWECLEFRGESGKEDSGRSRTSPDPPKGEPALSVREPGLCSWCENEPTCTFPRQTGGVWFCEEFH
jgi:hypothetical protein